eukprot:CAMPEP_0185857186 /NCGR_PEP_ID=MMETSP1354-20130828/29377_1 /TAXON_ID=708628 /ORGANISM="Erythrolobus madagascarensis, Strain CCMP3276" /LENGTH=625 /DNA_ID=CAMNT_0028559453 /DNA_START=58 /DNA_END=1935 /DNA_ORIENTATION=-
MTNDAAAASAPQSSAINAAVAPDSEDRVRGNHGSRRILKDLQFDDSFVRELPQDACLDNTTRQVKGAAYSLVSPTPAMEDCSSIKFPRALLESAAPNLPREPRFVAFSRGTAALLGMDPDASEQDETTLSVLCGDGVVDGMKTYAQCYGGHQFGNWAGQLGDGRALTLGETVVDGQRWELQLKGAGKTPYSRFADGRAVLRSSLREYLCSEAMAALGVPTTRALSLAVTGAVVIRDQFYQGDPRPEPGAVVCRVAPSFLRIGSLELPASRGDLKLMRQLVDYIIRYHFPEIASAQLSAPTPPADGEADNAQAGDDQVVSDEDAEKYTQFLAAVIRSNAELVAQWQTLGFVHGVLNTDNTSLLGLTIDYGPYGFLDEFDPSYTPNTTDIPGRRYCYTRQPMVILWNLLQLAQTLAPLIGVPAAEREINKFRDLYDGLVGDRWRLKLGLLSWIPEKDNETLLQPLHELMTEYKVDFTNLFRELSSCVSLDGAPSVDSAAKDAIERLQERGVLDKAALDDSSSAAKWSGWFETYVSRLMEDRREGDDDSWDDAHRRASMNRVNPKYILRNYLAQQAIEKVEEGDDSLVRELETVLQHPYDEQPEFEKYTARPPAWAQRRGVCVNSCSS